MSSRLLGYFFIVLVALIWNLASVLVQYIFEELHFDQPLFLTFVAHSLFSIYLPIWGVGHRFQLFGVKKIPITRPYSVRIVLARIFRCILHPITPEHSCSTTTAPTHQVIVLNYDHSSEEECDTNALVEPDEKIPMMSLNELAVIGLVISPIWFLANGAYMYSLSYTTNTSSTIISTTSSLFTFLFATLFTSESFSWLKLVGVVVCMGGATLVALSDSDSSSATFSPQSKVMGDLLALVSAIGYASYTILLKVMCGKREESVSMMPLLGFLGLFGFVILSPFMLLFWQLSLIDLSGLSPFIFLALVVKGLFDNVLADYLWARACLLTSPTVATVGLALTVPMAVLSDFVTGHNQLNVVATIGGLFVLLGFLLVNEVLGSSWISLSTKTKPRDNVAVVA